VLVRLNHVFWINGHFLGKANSVPPSQVSLSDCSQCVVCLSVFINWNTAFWNCMHRASCWTIEPLNQFCEPDQYFNFTHLFQLRWVSPLLSRRPQDGLVFQHTNTHMVHNSMCRVALHLICKQKPTYQGKCYMMHGVITRLWMYWILTENIKPPWWWRDRRGETRRSCNKCVKLKYWSGAQSWFSGSISETIQFYWHAAITWRDVPERREWPSKFNQ
jgi:hypothetical protein